MPETATTAEIHNLKDLTRRVQRAEGFPQILAALKNGRGATLDGAWGSAGPLAAAAIGLHAPQTLLIVVAHVGDIDDYADDVATFAGVRPEVLPAWDRLPREVGPGDEVFGRRIRVAKALAGDRPPRYVVAPFQALLQPVPRLALLEKASRAVRVGDTVPVEGLARWLVEKGMERVEVVEERDRGPVFLAKPVVDQQGLGLEGARRGVRGGRGSHGGILLQGRWEGEGCTRRADRSGGRFSRRR